MTDSDVEDSIQRQLLPTEKATRKKGVLPVELRSTPRRTSKRVTSGNAAAASPAKKHKGMVKPESGATEGEGEGEDSPIVYSNGRTTPSLLSKPRGKTPHPTLNSPQAPVPIGSTTPTRSLISTLETRYTQLELDLAAERALRVRLEKEIEELRVLRKKETIQRLGLEEKMEEYEERYRVEEEKWRAEIRELVLWRDRVRKAVND